MRLTAPLKAQDFKTSDIYGNPFDLRDFRGKKVVLSFFRNAGCPFCNFRVYQLTQTYQEWKDRDVEIVAVFSDTPEQVRNFVARKPRPFLMLADPNLELYDLYHVEHSVWAAVKALLFKLPTFARGLRLGVSTTLNPHPKLVPADFLIDEKGVVKRTWYGRNTSDHIPLEEIYEFIDAPVVRGKRFSPSY